MKFDYDTKMSKVSDHYEWGAESRSTQSATCGNCNNKIPMGEPVAYLRVYNPTKPGNTMRIFYCATCASQILKEEQEKISSLKLIFLLK